MTDWRDETLRGRLDDHRVDDAAWRESTPAPVELRSGPWAIELRGDELAHIRFEGVVVLRGVRAVARDADWGTADARRTGLRLDGPDGAARIDLRLSGRGVALVGGLEMTTRDGTATDADALTVAFSATATRACRANRVGLVVLHPPSSAGAALVVRHPGGGTTSTAFPVDVAPHQPARDIRALAWAVDALDVDLTVDGDVFEMEDQRNWTDASFKTYSRPLSRPFPFEIPEGGAVRQTLTLRVSRRSVASPAPPARTSSIRLAPTGAVLPEVGTSAGAVGTSAAPPPGPTLLVEVDTTEPAWRADLARAVSEAGPVALDVRIVVAPGDGTAIGAVTAALAGCRVVRAGVFDSVTQVTTPTAARLLGDGLVAAGLDPERVGGARSHFTELNRGRTGLPDGLDSWTFSITPQMHATDVFQIGESVAMQRLVARQAVAMAPSGRVHVGPITLRPRFNAVATSGSSGRGGPETVDHRQGSTATAAWVVASAVALAVPGVASLSFFESLGPRGLRDGTGAATPAAEVVEALSRLSGGAVHEPTDALPEGVRLAGVATAAGLRLIAANLTSSEVSLRVAGPDGDEGADRRVVVPAWGSVIDRGGAGQAPGTY
ncbi:hypothetical protein [Frigoribacterium sp. Leaf172]|uniref:hypothetical protein n=1 Tax=Frigoribacterium sp. Leaf172 TaxID=1736285 RepID=UPI0006F7BD21|nr:hypothetical protein [Frigoribacterium sp. Leaf172]KQR63975.1 hypothetical protein ASF89_12905 [Frigoribacterium sp. Leaf172]